MIKTWLISTSAPVCGTDTYYVAYSETNPELLEEWDSICENIIQELWDSYSWTLHLEDDEYDSEEEEQEAYEQALEDWRCDCNISVDEVTQEDLEDIAPGGNIDDIEIVYDERQ
jgi:hypothetical protein